MSEHELVAPAAAEELRVEYMALPAVRRAVRNPKRHDDAELGRSMGRFGYTEPMMIDERTGRLVAGHGRLEVLEAMKASGHEPPARVRKDPETGDWLAPVLRGVAFNSDQEAEAYLLASNRLVESGGWEDDELLDVLCSLRDGDGLDGIGFTNEDIAALLDSSGETPESDSGRAGAGALANRFGIPPFSVLDARQGYWIERRRSWLALGMRSHLGRGSNLLNMSNTVGRAFGQDLMRGEGVTRTPDGGLLFSSPSGRQISTAEFLRDHYENFQRGGGMAQYGTSIFDPVLCEFAYRWFCPSGGSVLDPFAGGSVRGIVAAVLGHPYTGVDLRAEQVEANEHQAEQILAGLAARSDRGATGERQGSDTNDPDAGHRGALAAEGRTSIGGGATWPRWIVGDACRLDEALGAGDGPFDLLFSCPPYYDLEQYSDDPADLSNASDYSSFLAGYRKAVAASLGRLRDNRFAVFVVSEVRGADGAYHDLVGDTVRAFCDVPAVRLYNEASYVSPAGSLPIRAGKQFITARKLGRTHQNVLVFLKGSAADMAADLGPVSHDSFAFPSEEPDAEGVEP